MSEGQVIHFAPEAASRQFTNILRRLKTLEDEVVLIRAQTRLDARRRRLGIQPGQRR